MPDRKPTMHADPERQAAVLKTCRELIEAGQRPSLRLICRDTGIGEHNASRIRRALIDSGRLALPEPGEQDRPTTGPDRPEPGEQDRPTTGPDRPAEIDKASVRARTLAILKAKMRKNRAGRKPELEKKELDRIFARDERRAGRAQ